MNLVDSSGWLEYFKDGPNAAKFELPLSDRDNLLVPSISIYEVFKVVMREKDENAAIQAIALMQQGQIIELNAELAISAAKSSLQYNIPMADSIIFSTGILYKATIWTQDAHFAGLPNVWYFT
jgi:toxin FitB